jgi:hypothetical protein
MSTDGLEMDLRKRRAIAKAINFGLTYGSSVKTRIFASGKTFEVGDHVVMRGPSRAWGEVYAVFDDHVLVAWDNPWDRQVLGNGPFWNGDLELESDLDRFAREV